MDKIVIFKKPGPLVKKDREKRTLDAIWPKIVDHVTANPSLTNNDLFEIYGSSCNEPERPRFIRRCKLRGLDELRSSLKEKRDRNTSRQLTEKRVVTIEEKRKKGGIKFIHKMDKLVQSGMDSLAEESEAVAEGKAHLGDHIINMKNMVKVGKEVYNIDADGGGDEAKRNIAILIGFDPRSAMKTTDEVLDI